MNSWEISNTYSGLQMSDILMNTPKIKFLWVRFLRTAPKTQHSLAGVVLQNRQEIELLTPEQGGTCAILNETCCFWVNTSSYVSVSESSRKIFHILQNLRERAGGFSEWLQSLFGGFFSWWRGIWSWLMPLLIPVITIMMLLMIVPCIIDHLTYFVSA